MKGNKFFTEWVNGAASRETLVYKEPRFIHLETLQKTEKTPTSSVPLVNDLGTALLVSLIETVKLS